ncbi:MAG: hypothetical protein ACO36E_07395 [Synechocystis sp.]
MGFALLRFFFIMGKNLGQVKPMVQFWVLIVVILFIGVQLFQWLQGAILPLPFYVMAGAFLAIASNYDKGMGQFIQRGEETVATLTEAMQAELDSQDLASKPDLQELKSLKLPEFAENTLENPPKAP